MMSTIVRHWTAIFGLAAALPAISPVLAQAEADAVRASIQAFADGAAAQDPALLERTLHPASMQYIAGPEVRSVDRPTYLAAIRDKKMGGLPMSVAIQHLRIDGNTAQAQATFSAVPFTLSHALSLVKVGGQWMIVSTVVRMIPK
jgi:Putative lumazine-binding